MRAALYARVSSAGQRDRHTIESQLRDLPAFCAARGWTVVGIYTDDGKSAAAGKLAARDAFARLVADAAAGMFDVVVVVDQDRLTRTEDMRERGAILGAFQAAGVKVAVTSTGQVLDYRTDEGDLLGSLGAYFAAVENRKRRARVIAGQTTAATRGRKPRGWTPYGLTYDPATGLWGVDPIAADVVREVIARVAAGEPTAAVGRDLEARGVKRPGGGRWAGIRIRALVYSDTYVGRYVVDGARGLAVAVPQIVDPELAADARAVLAARYRKPPPGVKVPRLLTDLARCALCGEAIGVAISGGERTLVSYRCLGRRHPRPGHVRCVLPTRAADRIDARLWEALTDALTNPSVVDRALAYLDQRDTAADDPEPHRLELARLDRAQSAILAQLARGTVSQDVADAQIDRLGRARRDAQTALAEAQRRAAGIRGAVSGDRLAESLAALARGCELAKDRPDLRRRVARGLIARAVWRPGVVAADLTIDVPSRVQADGSACRPGLPVRLGSVTIGTDDYRRRAA